jgi:hypothetical protein
MKGERCAVVDCPEEGRTQVCPYDGKYHHHGRIHYGNDHPKTKDLLTFREGAGWELVCDTHKAVIEAALGPLPVR